MGTSGSSTQIFPATRDPETDRDQAVPQAPGGMADERATSPLGQAPSPPSGAPETPARTPGRRPEPTRSRLLLACRDIGEGLSLWRLAVALGWLDIRMQFNGSRIGPFWLTLTTGIMIGSMGWIYAQIFHLVLREYLPYLAISLILWQAGISALMQESCTTFTNAAHTIRSVNMPYSVQAFRTLVRCGVVFGYNIIAPVAVFVLMGAWPGTIAFLALPAIAVWMLDGVALCLLLGSLCARFRDIPPIIGSVMQIAFYVTPVIWDAHQLKNAARWLLFNPFYSLLEIVRSPLLGHAAAPSLWLVASGFSVALWAAALLVFSRARRRLAFWI
ncbi:ABC transporter permease [Acetobacter sp. TBRC 12305]|uniref:ABC transporter permease n=2 Tax=Acetobacter garciniae TaxID=2817435 RepID=A0A939KMD5_9PROT|nr:ABC transporter permease [Acetobacter garciniae]MBX0344821.1 ABC transporter permease [Acetobacter garciniae]